MENKAEVKTLKINKNFPTVPNISLYMKKENSEKLIKILKTLNTKII